MKKLIMTMTIILSINSFANCLPAYQDKFAKIDRLLFPARATTVNSTIITTSTQVALGIAGATTATAIAASGAGIAAIGITYGALALHQNQFNKMIKLINEAERGDGKHLRKLQKQLKRRFKTEYSTESLAQFILEQNESKLICEYDVEKGKEIPMPYRKFRKYISKNL